MRRNPNPKKPRDTRLTIGEVADNLIGPGADEFLLEDGDSEAAEPSATVEVGEREVAQYLSRFGIVWDNDQKGVLIIGPPHTVERIVAILAATFLVAKLIDALT